MSESELPARTNEVLYSPRPDSDFGQTLDGMDVELALSTLSERNRRIIEAKYGLADNEP